MTPLELAREQEICSEGFARLLREIEPAPFEAQARAHALFKRAGAHMETPIVRAMIRAGQAPGAGRALGGAMGINFRNYPTSDPFRASPEVFEEATIKRVWKSATQDFRGFAQKQSGFELDNRGWLAELELIFRGTWTRTDGTGAVTLTDYAPYGLIELIELSVNSETLKSVDGLMLDYRRQAVTRKAVHPLDVFPNNAGANTWELRWPIPVAADMRTLWGGIYAQADDLNLHLDIINAAKTKMAALTGTADATITNAVYELVYTAFDTPWVNIEGVGLVIVLPDTDVIHRFHQYGENVVATGEKRMKLQRTHGEVLRIFLYLDNASSTLLDPSSLDEIRFAYLATEEPMRWPAKTLLTENARYYTNRITPKGIVVDLTVANQRRDTLYPQAIVDPEIVVKIPSSVTINSGARLYAGQEMLAGGV